MPYIGSCLKAWELPLSVGLCTKSTMHPQGGMSRDLCQNILAILFVIHCKVTTPESTLKNVAKIHIKIKSSQQFAVLKGHVDNISSIKYQNNKY